MKIESGSTAYEQSKVKTEAVKEPVDKGQQKISKSEGYAILSQQDQMTISMLKGETDSNFQSLRDIVKDLLQRQGVDLDKLQAGKTVKVDDQARAEAAKMIAEDGPMGVTKTAERIFQFAKAISGGDKGKLDKLREAIDAGYKAAAKAFGGELPEISKKTIELVNSKLDAWEKEDQAAV